MNEFCVVWRRVGVSLACSGDDLLEIGVGDFGDAFDGGVVGEKWWGKFPCLSQLKIHLAQPSPVYQGFKALSWSPDAAWGLKSPSGPSWSCMSDAVGNPPDIAACSMLLPNTAGCVPGPFAAELNAGMCSRHGAHPCISLLVMLLVSVATCFWGFTNSGICL